MRSMTFQINDQSTGGAIPAVVVTITENANGSVSFTLNVVGSYTGDLRGFFFDLANESLIRTLRVTPTSPGFTEFRQGNDTVTDLGNGADMKGLLGTEPPKKKLFGAEGNGYDAGIEIGTPGIGKDDYQSFSFTLSSSARALTLEDFSNVDFGARLTSVGPVDTGAGDDDHDDDHDDDDDDDDDGSREGSVKLLEHTSRAIDARDDANSVKEDTAPNPVSGNVFSNDANAGSVHRVTAVNGSTSNVGTDIAGTYGTLHLNAGGTYIYTLDNSKASVQALAEGQQVSESFIYTARRSAEATEYSTDSAVLTITITGTNDMPVITGGVAASALAELADNAPGENATLHTAVGTIDFSDVDLSDGHTVAVTPASPGYRGVLTAEVSDVSTGDGSGQMSWTFAVEDAALDDLAALQTLTQTYAVTLNDGHGGSATQDVTITITGTNDAPDINEVADTPTLTVPQSGVGGEFEITHDTGINDYLSGPRIASLDDGGFVVTWHELSGDSWDVWAERFGSTGQAQNVFQIDAPDSIAFRFDRDPAVAQLESDNLVFVWHSFDPNTGARDVLGRVFDASGTALTAERALDTTDATEQLRPEVAAHGDGFIATWTAFVFDPAAGTFSSEIFGQLLDASAQTLGEQFQISPSSPGSSQSAFYSPVASLADGGYIVLFREEGSSTWEIRGQRYDAANAPLGGSFMVTSGSAGFLDSPDVAALPDRGFVATWSAASPEDWDVYAQRFAADGSMSGSAIVVSTDETGLARTDFHPAVAATAEGEFAVTWSTGTNVNNTDILLQRFTADGLPAGGEVQVNGQASVYDFHHPDIAVLDSGALAVTWYAASSLDGQVQTSVFGRLLGGGGIVTNEDVPVALNIFAALTDIDGSESLSITISGVPEGATLSSGIDNGGGTWILTPAQLAGLMLTPAANSDEDITLTVTATSTEIANRDQASISRSFTITVNPRNDAPVAVDDMFQVTPQGGGLTEDETALINVLANDHDVDAGDMITVTAVSATTYDAALTINADGTVFYDPRRSEELQALNDGDEVIDTFTYTITDSHGATDDATVSVRLFGVTDAANSAPVAVADSNAGDVEDAVIEAGVPIFPSDPHASGNVLANDTDPDHDALHVSAVNDAIADVDSPVAGTYGSVQINTDGSWNYTLDNFNANTNALKQGESASDQFSYTVSDEHATDTQRLTIDITGTNDAPVAVADNNSVTEDLFTTATGNVLFNDSDVEGTILSVISAPILAGAYGELTLNPDGSYDYQLDPSLVNFLAEGEVVHDVFDHDYLVSDGLSFTQTTLLDITITGTDEAPSVADGTGSDLPIGLAGADTFDFNNLSEGTDTIGDFTPGAGGDVLDIRDILLGYAPGSSNLGSFVQVTEFGGNSTVLVNADGAGSDFVALATLQGVTGLLLNDLVANGNLLLT